LASIGRRYLAAMLDYLQFMLVFMAYVHAFGELNDKGEYVVRGLKALPVFLYWFVYFPLIEGLFGQTAFKFAFDLKVVNRVDHAPLGLRNALKRHLLDPIDMLFLGLIGVLVMRNSPLRQRIGDQIAGTSVIRT
jgi:uncharacterized RDD family membrane protein YckC